MTACNSLNIRSVIAKKKKKRLVLSLINPMQGSILTYCIHPVQINSGLSILHIFFNFVHWIHVDYIHEHIEYIKASFKERALLSRMQRCSKSN